jgi:hypothetical protein
MQIQTDQENISFFIHANSRLVMHSVGMSYAAISHSFLQIQGQYVESLTLCLSYLNPYCRGRITAFFQRVFKFTYYDKSALEHLEGQATFKFRAF